MLAEEVNENGTVPEKEVEMLLFNHPSAYFVLTGGHLTTKTLPPLLLVHVTHILIIILQHTVLCCLLCLLWPQRPCVSVAIANKRRNLNGTL